MEQPPPNPEPFEPSRMGQQVASMMEQAWTEPGFCVPNPTTYPHQWLWDSCFHSLIWLTLGRPDRATAELTTTLSSITTNGFVPHMTYWHATDLHTDFWGRPRTSSITQPPMYGHGLAALARSGVDPAPDLIDRAEAGLRHLLDRPRTPAGLVPIFHPWESGCDDSPRWDRWRSDPTDLDRWRTTKGELVSTITHLDQAPVANPSFTVGSVGFNALVAWNSLELADTFDRPRLRERADELVDALARRWRPDQATWEDDQLIPDLEPNRAGPPSSVARTLDSLLPLLVDPRDEGFDQLDAPDAFGARFGPCGVHRGEPGFDPGVYWRGPAWPQLTYLLARAAAGSNRSRLAHRLGSNLVDGAQRSGLAEYWHPDTGEGLGAIPQTWAGLAIVGARPPG